MVVVAAVAAAVAAVAAAGPAAVAAAGPAVVVDISVRRDSVIPLWIRNESCHSHDHVDPVRHARARILGRGGGGQSLNGLPKIRSLLEISLRPVHGSRFQDGYSHGPVTIEVTHRPPVIVMGPAARLRGFVLPGLKGRW